MIISDIFIRKMFNWIISLGRYKKRAILMALDFSVLSFALWAAYSYRMGYSYIPENAISFGLFILAPIISIIVFHFRKHYKMVTHQFNTKDSLDFYTSIIIATVAWQLILLFTRAMPISRSIIIGYIIFSGLFITSLRHLLAFILNKIISGDGLALKNNSLNSSKTKLIPVAIYGTGHSGQELFRALLGSDQYYPKYFIDDNPSHWNQRMNGVKILPPQTAVSSVEEKKVNHIFIAKQGFSPERQKFLKQLTDRSAIIKSIPRLSDIADGKVQISDLRNLNIKEILGRPPIPPQQNILEGTIRGKNILITGAGGSIGSELCRQALKLNPAKLILLDNSELALYEINEELKNQLEEQTKNNVSLIDNSPKLVASLSSVLDNVSLEQVIKNHQVDTIYHSAAYKHVPLVELNPRQGLVNNIYGTLNVARLAAKYNVDHMVLISTDKAVRPTNVMGASKRISELILQAFASEDNGTTKFTMVRFGNVLNSSGSVVRQFKRQIERGGPVTITHPDMVRYFMLISEAAQLVMQAATMARGGDVFVLDMGKPIKITDLAETMIKLMGHSVYDKEENPNGDISINYIGIREGEKLFEELILNDSQEKTRHPRIFRTEEPNVTMEILIDKLDHLKLYLNENNMAATQHILKELVEGYQTDLERFIPEDKRENYQEFPASTIQ